MHSTTTTTTTTTFPPVAFQDVPGQPFLMMRSKENDPERMSLYPSLDYKGLYSTLLNFIDLVQERIELARKERRIFLKKIIVTF